MADTELGQCRVKGRGGPGGTVLVSHDPLEANAVSGACTAIWTRNGPPSSFAPISTQGAAVAARSLVCRHELFPGVRCCQIAAGERAGWVNLVGKEAGLDARVPSHDSFDIFR